MQLRLNQFGIKRSLFALSVFSLVTGCGPVYDTQYQFSPPDSAAGRSCIFQCESGRQQCQQLEDYKARDCETRSDWDKRRCEEDIYRKKNREPKWYECGGSSCSADYDRCEGIYRSCYQSCGGEVKAETRCVSNCDQIPPAPQPPAPPPPPPPKKGKK